MNYKGIRAELWVLNQKYTTCEYKYVYMHRLAIKIGWNIKLLFHLG